MGIKIGNLEVYGIIYKITNKINGKIYIGQTIQKRGFKGRYHNNLYKFTHNSHLKNSIKKYGIENFEINEMFDIAFSKDELNIKEELWILNLKSFDNKYGYNRTFGGDSNIPNEESRKLISKNHADLKGDKNPNSKKVICLNTKQIFCSVSEAMKKFNIYSSNGIGEVCNNKRNYCGKINNKPLLWMWKEEFDKYTNEEIDNIFKIKFENAKEVIKINNNKEIILTYKNNTIKLKSKADTKKWLIKNNIVNSDWKAKMYIKNNIVEEKYLLVN